MSDTQMREGRKMWQRTAQEGRLAKSSFNAEEMAPKTWILYANSRGDEISTIEAELYTIGRMSDSREAVVMLHGMCPKCAETFIAREDNKTMYIEYVEYRKAPKFLQVNWVWHCEHVLHRRFSESDKLVVVSSPERWACDYCRRWCVKVHAGVAVDDHRGVTQLTVPVGTQLIDKPRDVEPPSAIDF